MSKEQLPPGRELDERVARALGWRFLPKGESYKVINGPAWIDEKTNSGWFGLPEFSKKYEDFKEHVEPEIFKAVHVSKEIDVAGAEIEGSQEKPSYMACFTESEVCFMYCKPNEKTFFDMKTQIGQSLEHAACLAFLDLMEGEGVSVFDLFKNVEIDCCVCGIRNHVREDWKEYDYPKSFYIECGKCGATNNVVVKIVRNIEFKSEAE